jgi:hypothetical protein
LTSRNDDAHSPSVASIEAPDIQRTPNRQDVTDLEWVLQL